MVALPAHHVDGPEAGHDVRQHMSRDQSFEARGSEETRRADAHSVWRAAAVAHQVEAELAVATLCVRIHLAGWELDAFHDNLEVLNGAFVGAVHFVFWRQHYDRIVDLHGAAVWHAL